MDGEKVLAQARQGRAAPNWQVLPVRARHFMQNMAIFGVAAATLVVLLVVLALHPNNAVTTGSSIDSDSALSLWRMADFIIGAVLALACVGATVLAIRDYRTRNSQMLVLMPEGFVMRTGIGTRSLRTISYGTIGAVNVSVYRGQYTLKMPRLDGHGTIRVQLDARFGPPKPIVQQITTAQARFAASRTSAQRFN